tara:strand:+ start:6093 stop:6254 length:162 start_codon:yes stop_codon:yes gene_type:complete
MNRIWTETTWKVKQQIEEETRKVSEEELKLAKKKLRLYEKYKSFIDNAVPIKD